MDRDIGQYIGLIAIGSGALVLGLSYLGVYLLGQTRGRRDEEGARMESGQADLDQRVAALEASVHGISHTLERLMDAQRLLVAQQDHLSRKVGLPDRQPVFGEAKRANTPA